MDYDFVTEDSTNNKLILGLWISNRSLKVCQSARSPAKNVSHYNNLEKCFPENPLLEDDYLNFPRWIKRY